MTDHPLPDHIQRMIADLNAADARRIKESYTYRSTAVRAARAYCKTLLGKGYQPAEGPDYLIHSFLLNGELTSRYRYEIRPVVLLEHQRIAAERVAASA